MQLTLVGTHMRDTRCHSCNLSDRPRLARCMEIVSYCGRAYARIHYNLLIRDHKTSIEASCGRTGRGRVSGQGHTRTKSGNTIPQRLAAMIPTVLADRSMISANWPQGCLFRLSDISLNLE